ncbi:hypothetical protein [Nocardia abscessus]|nr:hypothetical protein [Nocardia abscessus]
MAEAIRPARKRSPPVSPRFRVTDDALAEALGRAIWLTVYGDAPSP